MTRKMYYLIGSIILGIMMEEIGVPPDVVIFPTLLYLAFGIWFLVYK